MSSYDQHRERDYEFADTLVTLRAALGLTQHRLATLLLVSRSAVASWEGGLSYPKVERLKQLIALGVRASAWAWEREEEQIHSLWRAARQKELLDEDWLADLLASARPVPLSPPLGMPMAPLREEPAAFSRVDWVGAPDVSHFAGREVELAELTQWILQERCRLVSAAAW